jgi:hypothetical protein
MSTITGINNAVLEGKGAMPLKSLTSDNDSRFRLARHNFVETSQPAQTNEALMKKKFFLNRDASSVIDRRRNQGIGGGSLNTTNGPTSFTGNVRNTSIQDAARKRARSGGAVVPKKVSQRYNNNN